MFSNRYQNRNNMVGIAVKNLRKGLKISQRELADRLVAVGLVIDKNAVQRIEDGKRFVTDIEIVYIAKMFDITVGKLYELSTK